MGQTYKIIGVTTPWIAQRDVLFNGKTIVELQKGLSLRDAKKELLRCFCEDYDRYFPNWGVARNSNIGCMISKYSDGTYSYEYDSRRYFIVEENEINFEN